VAFEMAQQLLASNQAVDLLCLIDTPAIGQPLFSLEDDADILAFVGNQVLPVNGSTVSAHELRTMPTDEQLPYLLQAQNGHENGFTLPQIQQLLRVIKANRSAMQAYAAQPYPGRIVFFRAQEGRAQAHPARPEHFWLDIASGGFEMHLVPGNHFTMNRQPHVQAIAETLEVCLRRVEVELR
jgi:thioesterase domain-containing protein